jgi:uncharacterized protein YbcI
MADLSIEGQGVVSATVSDGLVHLHKQYYGKGPTKAKTYLLNDAVICLLRGGFTFVEKTLIQEGRAEAVHDIRRSFQGAMGDRFKEIVEQATGRSVIAYMSQVHAEPELALEVFVLEQEEPVEEEQELHLTS